MYIAHQLRVSCLTLKFDRNMFYLVIIKTEQNTPTSASFLVLPCVAPTRSLTARPWHVRTSKNTQSNTQVVRGCAY